MSIRRAAGKAIDVFKFHDNENPFGLRYRSLCPPYAGASIYSQSERMKIACRAIRKHQ